jgi:rhamnosyltransferase
MADSAVQALVSIFIPTKNAGVGFRDTLTAIRRQTLNAEIFIIDSGSTDGTLELANEFNAHTTIIRPESFNHGETRNLGVAQTRTQFCVMLVQDAVPIGERWLEQLLSPFSDDRVVGVTAQQVPRPDSNPIARWQVEYRIQFLGETSRVQELESWEHFLTLGFQERLRLASFDNVCSAVRRSFWEMHPFRAIPFAEDLDWGMRAIRAGGRLVYNPAARVVHSHNRPAAYHLKRSYVSGRIVPTLLHLDPIDPGVYDDKEFLRLVGSLSGEARTILVDQVEDWRAFARRSEVSLSIRDFCWSPIRSLLRPRQETNRMRGNFYFILDQLAPLPGQSGLNASVPAALAEAAGAFIAEYYNWCEARGAVSDELRKLDQALSRGI